MTLHTVMEVYSWCGLATLAMICGAEFYFEGKTSSGVPLSMGEIACMCAFWPFTWLLLVCAVIGEIEDRL